jgi:glutathione-regulated potassium-efflux system ancillary protein KefC
MDEQSFLFNALIYLTAAVISVPISKRLGLGSVLGYLFAGVVIGPWGIGFITHVEDILHFSEFGVVLLLFLIGLELNPARLWSLKKSIFGMGSAQVFLTGLVLFGLGRLAGLELKASIIAGMALALSSTAIALQTLSEKNLLKTNAGHSAFSILLFQDMAVIPMLTIIPLLGAVGPELGNQGNLFSVIKIFGAILGLFIAGRYLSRPLFRIIANTNIREIFTAFSLLLVIGIALLMRAMDMSMALGSFIAGVILSDSEYRHELEIDIEPFKGLLLGLFFISVGMSIKLGIVLKQPFLLFMALAALLVIKSSILFVLGKICKIPVGENFIFAFVISQGGEFAFVLFSMAQNFGIFHGETVDFLIALVALSMATTPILLVLNEKWIQPRFRRVEKKESDTIEAKDNAVIIVGFGRFGQVVGRLLHSKQIGTTILDHNPNNIEMLRKYGFKVFYGDAARMDLLETAGARNAKILVLSIDDPEMLIETAKKIKKQFPHLSILAKASDRLRAHELLSLGIKTFTQEFYHSALILGEEALKELGYGAYQAKKAALKFKEYDTKTFYAHHPYHQDEVKRISLAQEARKEMEELFKTDEDTFNKDKDASWG